MAKDLSPLTASSTNPFGRPPRRRPRGREKRRLEPGGSPLLPRLRGLLAGADWSRISLVVVTTLVLSALLSLHLLPDKVSLHVGDISPQDIISSHAVSYLDSEATEQLREAAASRVDPVYAPVPSVETYQTITEVYARLRRERSLGNTNAMRVARELREQVGVEFAPASLLTPLLRDTSSPYHLDQAQRLTHWAIQEAISRGIRNDHAGDLQDARADVTAKIAASSLPSDYIPGVMALARAILRPTLLYQTDLTAKARESARRQVAPQYSQIFAGDIVVRRGETVTPDIILKFRALGLQNPRLDPAVIACVTLLVALLVFVTGVYLSHYHPAVYSSTKTLVLLSLLVSLSVLGVRLSSSMMGVRLSESQYGYVGMLCIAAAAMLIAALIRPRVAMFVTALLAAQSGLIQGNDLRFSMMTLLSGFAAILAVSNIRSRNDVLRAGGIVCGINMIASLLLGRIAGDTGSDLGQSLIWAFFSGVFSVALFSFGAALFERLFGITTHLGLLELSDPNRPLLQKFCQLAPGTYTHSVMVGNLAVAAAEAIGADALLCRVGALYHDLGKMQRAQFFVENQGGGDNVHERLNPSLSALVVTAHVKDGLEIAELEKLPPIIKSFITEHHGTSLIRYFYHQQRQGDHAEAAPGLEQQFRYAGPKPQSRETAILMLADGVEAASRTLEKPTRGRIEDLVAKIIAAQLTDGQLDECDLTQRDLSGIREAFVRLLSGMLHTRVEYPEMLKGNILTHVPAPSPPDGLVSIAECRRDSDAAAESSVAA